jgi:hypothetical protein
MGQTLLTRRCEVELEGGTACDKPAIGRSIGGKIWICADCKIFDKVCVMERISRKNN